VTCSVGIIRLQISSGDWTVFRREEFCSHFRGSPTSSIEHHQQPGYALISRTPLKGPILGVEERHGAKKQVYRRVQAGSDTASDAAESHQEPGGPGAGDRRESAGSVMPGLCGQCCGSISKPAQTTRPGNGLPQTLTRPCRERTGFFTSGGNVLRERVEVEYHTIDRCRDAFLVR